MLTRSSAASASSRSPSFDTTPCSTPRAASRIAFAIARRDDSRARSRRCRAGRADTRRRTSSGSRRARRLPRCRADQEAAELSARCRRRSPSRSPSKTDWIVPSSSLRQTFPVKPSQTTTSPAPSSSSRLSTLPPKFRSLAREQLVRLERQLVALLGLLPDREQTHLGVRRCRGSPRRRSRPSPRTGAGARGARPRSRRSRGAPMAPCATGSTTAIAGRSTPRRRRISSSDAASIAPVFPAETTAAARPAPTARHAATSELSGFAADGLGRLLLHPDLVRRRDELEAAGVQRLRAEQDGLDVVRAARRARRRRPLPARDHRRAHRRPHGRRSFERCATEATCVPARSRGRGTSCTSGTCGATPSACRRPGRPRPWAPRSCAGRGACRAGTSMSFAWGQP